MPFQKQMGNIGSELSRALRFHKQQDAAYLQSSLWRALELIGLTIDAQAGNSRTWELCRFREVVCDWYCGSGVYRVSPEYLANYALDFVSLVQVAPKS